MKINAIICKNCGDTIYSRSIHDFHWCSCNSVAIDGGFDYTKIVFKSADCYESTKLNILENETEKSAKKILYDDWNNRENKYGIIHKNEYKEEVV